MVCQSIFMTLALQEKMKIEFIDTNQSADVFLDLDKLKPMKVWSAGNVKRREFFQ